MHYNILDLSDLKDNKLSYWNYIWGKQHTDVSKISNDELANFKQDDQNKIRIFLKTNNWKLESGFGWSK